MEQSLQRGHVKKLSYIHSSNMMRPQLKWADKIDNSDAPFRPIIQHKPNALKPLPSSMYVAPSYKIWSVWDFKGGFSLQVGSKLFDLLYSSSLAGASGLVVNLL